MKAVIRTLRRISDNPWLSAATGLILFATGLAEAWETLAEDLSAMDVGAHHGVMVFGVVQMFRALPDLFEGIEYFTRKMD